MNFHRGWLGLVCCMSVAVIGQSAEPKRHEFQSKHMGTLFKIVLYAEDEATAKKASQDAFARIAQLDAILSDYNPNSEMMKLCQANDTMAGEPVKVSADLFNVLDEARRISQLTDGHFDVTVGPVVKLWRLARRTQVLPDKQELSDAMKLVGYEKITLDAQHHTVSLKLPKMRLDFGGIGKGFAADEALKVLKKHGISQALVAASGDVTCGEAPPGETGWRVEILSLTKSEPVRVLRLANRSVSTSGDLDQFVEIGGVRYSHVLNPKTGIGLTGRRSVTVISVGGTQTDALTKAASVMPQEQALKLIERLPETAGFWAIQEQGSDTVKQTRSERFEAYLVK